MTGYTQYITVPASASAWERQDRIRDAEEMIYRESGTTPATHAIAWTVYPYERAWHGPYQFLKAELLGGVIEGTVKTAPAFLDSL